MKKYEVTPADHDPGRRSPICVQCGLCNTGIVSPFIAARTATDDSSVQDFYLIVGEAPGKDEDTEGEAFIGQAGSILSRGMDAAGADNWRSSCIKDNVVRCRPTVRTQWGGLKNRKPSQKEIKHCVQFLFADIIRYRPKAILLLGDYALKAVLGLSGISDKRRRVFFLDIVGMHIPCVPAFHPAVVLYDGDQWERFKKDIEYFVDVCMKGVQSAESRAVTIPMDIRPSVDGVRAFHRDCLQKSLTVAVDVEADELLVYTCDDWRMLCIGVSNGIQTLVVPVDECGVEHEGDRVAGAESTPVVSAMLDILADGTIEKIGHNVKYDMHAVLRRFGMRIANVCGDTLAEHALLYPIVGGHDLETVASEILGIHEIKRESQEAMGGSNRNDPRAFGRLPYDILAARCGADCNASWRVHRRLLTALKKQNVLQDGCVLSLYGAYRQVVLPALCVLFEMECTGAYLDQAVRTHKETEYKTELQRLVDVLRSNTYVRTLERDRRSVVIRAYRDKLRSGARVKPSTLASSLKHVPWKPGSPDDVRAILYGQGGAGFGLEPSTQTASGAGSTDDDTLAAIVTSDRCSDEARAFAAAIREYRTRRTILSTFIVGIEDYVGVDGCIHPTFNLGVARTGRLSSSDPNLQNVPKRFDSGVRGLYTVRKPDHNLVSGDYSQIELRVLAAYSKDDLMRDAFLRGDDLHMITARKITGKSEAAVQEVERRAAKTVNFGIIYGQSAVGLSESLSREFERSVSVDESQRFIDEYFDLYPGVARWVRQMHTFAARHGFVYTMFGRRRDLANASRKGHDREIAKLREEAFRQAVNTPVQGTASDIALIAAVALGGVYKKLEKATGLFCRLIISVHDELLTECHERLVDRVVKIKRSVMCNVPQTFLKDKMCGIPIVVDLKIGRSWDNMTEVT